MKNKESTHSETVKINGKALKEKVEAYSSMNQTELSELILHKSKTYLRMALCRNSINRESLYLLCKAIKTDPKLYIITETKAEEPTIHNLRKDTKTTEQEIMEIMLIGMNQMFNNQKILISEIKNLQIQNKELINTVKNMGEMMKQINSDNHIATEKIKAIFTEVKYKSL